MKRPQTIRQRKLLQYAEAKAEEAQQRKDRAPHGFKLLALFRLRDARTAALRATP